MLSRAARGNVRVWRVTLADRWPLLGTGRFHQKPTRALPGCAAKSPTSTTHSRNSRPLRRRPNNRWHTTAGRWSAWKQSEHQLLEESLFHREKSHMAEIRWQSVNDQARARGQSTRPRKRLANLRPATAAAARCEVLRAVVAGTRARRETLEQILNDRSYTAEAVQKLFRGARRGSGIARLPRRRSARRLRRGAAASTKAPSSSSCAMNLQYVVVETFDHARAGIALLREEVGGRATFFVDSLRTPQAGIPINEPANPVCRSEPALVSRLDGLVEFRDPARAGGEAVPAAPAVGVPGGSAEAAERLARENPAYSFLTPDGTCYQGRAVTGGRPADAGPLVMKRELRSLEAETAAPGAGVAEPKPLSKRPVAAGLDPSGCSGNHRTSNVKAGKSVVGATLERDLARRNWRGSAMELSTCQKEIERLRAAIEAAQQRAERANPSASRQRARA
jgi:hypothetical protein